MSAAVDSASCHHPDLRFTAVLWMSSPLVHEVSIDRYSGRIWGKQCPLLAGQLPDMVA